MNRSNRSDDRKRAESRSPAREFEVRESSGALDAETTEAKTLGSSGLSTEEFRSARESASEAPTKGAGFWRTTDLDLERTVAKFRLRNANRWRDQGTDALRGPEDRFAETQRRIARRWDCPR